MDLLQQFETTKEIGIDAAHRVPLHASKCKSLHGHRYQIQATVRGQLRSEGSESGMVMDFGFLKELMMENIDASCDHGLVLYIYDQELMHAIFGEGAAAFRKLVETNGTFLHLGPAPFGKVYGVQFIPTAENLARHWFERLESRVAMRSNKNAELVRVQVWETPTSICTYEKPRS